MFNINEKSNSELKSDIFECNELEITEADGGQEGNQHILCKVKGSFFVPDGVSRNGRFYPRQLWDNVLSDERVKSYIENKRMYGTISHEQVLDDQALLEGKISHMVTELYIDEDGKGIGEAAILDTPAGRILNTIIRAGGRLFVSSRARGSYVRGKKREGMPIVDPDNYYLETFDFVLDPGFMEAEPQLVESLLEVLEQESQRIKEQNNKTSEGDNNMPKENENKNLISEITEEKNKVQVQLSQALEEIETLKSDNAVLTDEVNHLKEENTKFENIEKVLKEYKEIGSVKEIEEALSKAEDLTEAYEELGTPEKISEVFDKLEKLGTVDQINKAFDVLEEKVKAYEELGTPEKIGEAFDLFEQFQAEKQAEEDARKIKDIATECGVAESKVVALWDKMSESEIKEFFKDIAGEKTTTVNKNESKNNRFKKPAKSKTSEGKTGSLKQKLEGEKTQKQSPFETPLSKRLIKKFS